MDEKLSLGINEIEKYSKKYGARFTRALKTVDAGKVKKYVVKDAKIERWIVVGKEREYILVDNIFCSCFDFFHKVLNVQETDRCYHLLAKQIAEITQQFDVIEITFQEYQRFIQEWLY